MAAQAILGKVTTTYGSTWNASTTYSRNTIVEHEDNVYLSLVDNLVASEPSRSNSNWGWMGGKGDNGTNGAQGARGATWFSGTAVTDSSLSASVSGAAEGDFYLNTTTGKVYKRGASAWAEDCDLMAPVNEYEAAIQAILDGTSGN